MIGCESSWSELPETVLAAMQSDADKGLAASEAARRLHRFGHNQLRSIKRRPVWAIFIDQLKSIVVLLLLGAGFLALLFEDHIEGVAIFAVVGINTLFGFITEWRATRSMEALRRMGQVDTVVIRDGVAQHIPAVQLVPGDIVEVDGGNIITADMRLLTSAKLQADESALTGESLPVRKSVDTVSADTGLMERKNMLYKGTAVTRGSGRAVIVGTGIHTELGKIAELASKAESQATPLEKRLDTLAGRLVWVVIALALAVALAGLVTGRETWLAIEVAVVLAVSAIPEGLPIVATIALARGMWRMAQRNALIAKLSAVETLGATRVILTDKTGTLTENHMTVTVVCLFDAQVEDLGKPSLYDPAIDSLLETAALCSNACLTETESGAFQSVGDPMEVALLEAGRKHRISRDRLLAQYPERKEFAFDPLTKRMATIHQNGDAYIVAVKGALESVLPHCSHVLNGEGKSPLGIDMSNSWLKRIEELGNQGLRTLAIARKETGSETEDPFAGLTLLGIVGLEDPPRKGVKEAIARCRLAGIEVAMITGDHGATAKNIAIQTGIIPAEAGESVFVNGDELDARLSGKDHKTLLAVRVFSRVTPEQKLRLIDFYQAFGDVVAMTGDGVNDAPALKKADIGIAMGIRGTDVAKEAADMVLQDDDFNTIVMSVEHGRAIFENIRKFVVYLLSCNISEILVVSLATLAGGPLPLLPLQILFLNLVTDVFPALALGVGEGSPSLMQAMPRPPEEAVLTRIHWLRIAGYGAIIALLVLSAMAIAIFFLGFSTERAVTVSFCTLALAQLWHVFNMRSKDGQVINNEITGNPWICGAVVICIVLVLAAVYIPTLAGVLKLQHPGTEGWILIMAMSLAILLSAPLVNRFH